ncbi:hypothetical protein [Aminobacter sp. LjRoot7]|uniref:sulfotransferase family protein n=1 Tax=Aminobacter sp. LjRoot7 TaxID=3342335 RepID=UPI003ECD74DC
MHRSGTSALTRMLGLLGIDLPKTPLGGNETNLTGHWEPEPVVYLNDRILAAAGSSWRDFRPVDPRWFQSADAWQFRSEACAILAAEFGGTAPFVIKEPRICRLSTFWLDVFGQMNVRPVFILPIRNPLEVAASLKIRNGIQPDVSHLLWLRHVLEAELATRGRPRVFTTYDELLGDWRQLASKMQAALALAWPRAPGDAGADIDALLSDSHRHHREPLARLFEEPVPRGLRKAFEIVDRWSGNGESSDDFAELDRIKAEFEEASLLVSTAVASSAAEMRQLTSDLATMEAQVARAQQDLASTQQVLASTQQQLSAMQEQLAITNQQLTIQHREIELIAKQVDVLRWRKPRLGWRK